MACLPILELGFDAYAASGPSSFIPTSSSCATAMYEDEDGVVHTGDDVLSGEAWEQGPVDPRVERDRSRAAAARATTSSCTSSRTSSTCSAAKPTACRRCTATCACRSGSRRSTPPTRILCDQLERGEEPWLDPYAAEDPAEFFAVCAEMFFDVPQRFRAEYPGRLRAAQALLQARPRLRRFEPSQKPIVLVDERAQAQQDHADVPQRPAVVPKAEVEAVQAVVEPALDAVQAMDRRHELAEPGST